MHIAQTEIHMIDCCPLQNIKVWVCELFQADLQIYVTFLVDLIDKVVLNAKVLNTGQENCNRVVAATFQSTIQLWSVMVNNDGSLVTREISQSVR